MKRKFAFDARYYARYYENPRTRVGSQKEATRLGRLLSAYLAYLGQPVATVLDIGCGVGHMRPVVKRVFAGASYTGVEHSEYLCERYGWEQGSVVDWRSRKRYDLVICRGVLQYLPRSEAEKALDNLASLCRGCLYLEALTREDWETACDKERTDGAVYLRPASFYKRRLASDFAAAGAGLFVHESSPAVLYALETV